MGKHRKRKEKSHSWMRLFGVRKYGERENRHLLVRCKSVGWAQSHIPRDQDDNNFDAYILIIDDIEYTLEPGNRKAVEDALNVHEDFYEKEREESIKREAEKKADLESRLITLKGISTHRSWRDEGRYVQYVRCTSVAKIAKWIATTLTRKRDHAGAQDLSNMKLEMPNGLVLDLPSFERDDIPYEDFDPYQRPEYGDDDGFEIGRQPLYYSSYRGNWDAAKAAAKKAEKKWIKPVAKEIARQINNKIKTKQMMKDYQDKQDVA